MKASELYKWLFAEGEHKYDCEMMINDEYIKDSYMLIKEGRNVVVLSKEPSNEWCNEDIPCLFSCVPCLKEDDVIKITCTPFSHYAEKYKYKEISFKASEYENDLYVDPFNSANTKSK